jgi:molybdate transport system regulatory protein
MAKTQFSIRIDLESGGRIGPGKIALLEAIRKTGSITAAARSMQISYRRAWLGWRGPSDAVSQIA